MNTVETFEPCFCDWETRSKADLKVVGGYNYTHHESTEVLCGAAIIGNVAYVWGHLAPLQLELPDDCVVCKSVICSAEIPHEVLYHPGPFVAHNAEGFDRWLWERLGYPQKQWIDTLRQVGKVSLPGRLDAVAKTLYGRGKDEGGRLMLKLSKPMKNGRFFPVNHQNLTVVARYCLMDVDLMARMWYDELEAVYPAEAELVEIDAEINRRGFLFDQDLAQRIIESDALNRQAALDSLPIDASVLRSTKQLAEWLGQYEVELPNFQRGTISDFLTENTVPPVVEQVLLGRIGATKITSAKVSRAIGLQGKDGRIRNGLMYHAAHTGRWGGRGFQPHNLPRGVKMDVDAAVQRIMTTDWCPSDDELSTLIRACIRAPDGQVLLVVDWSQIEARVLPWLAGDTELLERIASGEDIYVAQASLMNTERSIGKVAVLACGYQGGGNTLGAFAEGYGVDFADLGLSPQEVVEMYRDANPKIAGTWTGSIYEGVKCRKGGLWRDLDAGLKEIAWGRAQDYVGGRCYWYRSGRHLKCRLPSGRELTYRNFTIEDRVPGWGGDPRPTMVYENRRGVVIPTYGGKLTENCFSGETLILTSKGAKFIKDITSEDLIWDGYSWVHSDGCVFQGKQEVGEWLGCHVTANHLIHDGSSWSEVIHLDEHGTDRCLEWGQHLVPSQSAVAVGYDVSRSVAAEMCESIATGNYGDLMTLAAQSVDSYRLVNLDEPITLSPHMSFIPFGTDDTRGSYADVTRHTAPNFVTTDSGGLPCATSGGKIEPSSLSTYGHLITGMYSDWTWTVSTMIKDISQGICAWLRDRSTAKTVDAETLSMSTKEKCIALQRLAEISLPDGVDRQFTTGSTKAKQSSKSWRRTNKRSRVYDIKNCGPKNQFMVLTPYGPVIAHNCTQAVARDVLVEAMINLEADGFKIVLHVHDEVICEGQPHKLERMEQIMCQVPQWAEGLPIDVDGFVTARYRK